MPRKNKPAPSSNSQKELRSYLTKNGKQQGRKTRRAASRGKTMR